jgi:hypothetical protein
MIKRKMIVLLKQISILFFLLLTGCASKPSLTANCGEPNTKWILKNINVNGSQYLRGISFNLKKNANNTIDAWFLCYPNDVFRFPLEKPQIIVKLYDENNLEFNKFQITGFSHIFAYWSYLTEYLQSIPKEQAAAKRAIAEIRHIWSDFNGYASSELMAIGFNITSKFVADLPKAEKVEFWVQTNSEPINILMTKKELAALEEFKHLF